MIKNELFLLVANLQKALINLEFTGRCFSEYVFFLYFIELSASNHGFSYNTWTAWIKL